MSSSENVPTVCRFMTKQGACKSPGTGTYAEVGLILSAESLEEGRYICLAALVFDDEARQAQAQTGKLDLGANLGKRSCRGYEVVVKNG